MLCGCCIIYRLTEEYRTSTGESWSALSADDWSGLTADGWGALTSTSGSYRNTFTYDPTGNRLVKNASGAITTSTYDVANQLVTSLDSSGTTTYSFDADGNQVLTVAPNGDRTTTTWDFENKTTLIQLPGGLRNTMAYDPDGLRVQLADSTGTTRFLYDGQAYLLEANSSNVVQAVYSQEPSAYGNVISQYRFDGTLWTPSYYHGDVLGSTSDLTDTGENVTDSYQYDDWGELLARTGTSVNPFQWIGGVGYYRDPDTELYFFAGKNYAPVLGRWTNRQLGLYHFTISQASVSARLPLFGGLVPGTDAPFGPPGNYVLPDFEPLPPSGPLPLMCQSIPCKDRPSWKPGDCNAPGACPCSATGAGDPINITKDMYLQMISSLGYSLPPDAELVVKDRCGPPSADNAPYGVTCPSSATGSGKLVVCLPSRNLDICGAKGLVAHEFTHVDQLTQGAGQSLLQNETDAYTIQCSLLADQNCLTGRGRSNSTKKCIDKGVSFSTSTINSNTFGDACKQF